jgi:hypothetical protein
MILDCQVKRDLVIASVSPLPEGVEGVVGVGGTVWPGGATAEGVGSRSEGVEVAGEDCDTPALLSGLDRVFFGQISDGLDEFTGPSQDGSRIPCRPAEEKVRQISWT